MKKKFLLFGLCIVFALGLCSCGSSDSGDAGDAADTEEAIVSDIEVVADTGTYMGHDNDGVQEFLGISYADPVGKWEVPQMVSTTSDDEIICDEWGPSCFQVDDDVEIASQWKQSHDCLDLNVWTRDVTREKKPVIVFIHGGGGWQGGTYDPCYDGEFFIRNLAEGEDAVLVSMNYRLGIFGSLNLSGLEGYDEATYADAINLATLDQELALRWVNENIASFGGDPENVTLMGQSFGAGSACTLLTIPEANQYFQHIILESGNIFNRQISLEKSEENSAKVFEILGVSSIDELMALSDEDIMAKYDQIDEELHHPHRVADGKVIPLDGYQALKDGVAKDIDVMIGTVSGEYDFEAIDWDNSISEPVTDPQPIIDYLEVMQDRAGDAIVKWSPLGHQDIIDEYLALGDDPVKRWMDLFNDSHYRQTAIFIAEALSEAGSDVYMYYWEWAPDKEAVLEAEGDSAEVSPWGRPMHCMEQILVFGCVEEGYPELAGPAEGIPEELVQSTETTWYSFAKNGDPNNDLIGDWSKYDTTDRETMIIGTDGSWEQQKDPRSEDRQVLDKIRP